MKTKRKEKKKRKEEKENQLLPFLPTMDDDDLVAGNGQDDDLSLPKGSIEKSLIIS